MKRNMVALTLSFILLLISSCTVNPNVKNSIVKPVIKTSSPQPAIFGLKLMEKLDEHTQYIFSVNFSNDGRLLASGSADKYVIIWDCMAWQPLKKIKESYYELWGIPVKFSMDNNYLAYGSYETLKLVSLTNDFEELTNVHAHDKGIQSLDISSDNRYIITAGVDSQLKVWNIPDLRQISSVKAHEKEVWSTYISPDARYAVSGGQDGYMKIWNFPELTLDRSVKFHNASIEYVSISIGLKFVLCASADSTVSVWKWGEYDAPYRILKGHSGDVPVALFSNDERFVITGGQDDYIMIFDIESGSMVYSNKAHTDDILSLGVNQKGNLLASSSRDRTIKIWQITQ